MITAFRSDGTPKTRVKGSRLHEIRKKVST